MTTMTPVAIIDQDGPADGPAGLEHKSAAATAVGSGAIPTKDPFEFEIIASVTGVRDLVGDVVVPGAYAETLSRRIPKVIKDHKWSDRLGKVLHIAEYPPGDPHLPRQTPRGEPWPAEAGALMAKVRLFKSEAGRDAAERWAEYEGEQEFSVGYAPRRSRRDAKSDTRFLHQMDLFEISDVLFGAMPLAGALPAPLATKVLAGIETDPEEDADADEGGPAGDELEAKAAETGADLPEITDPKSLKAAVTAHEKDPDPALKAHIVARAKALNIAFMLPKGWVGEQKSLDGEDLEDKAADGVSNRPWSEFSEADYTPGQWRRACLLDTGEGAPEAKGRFRLPVREPDGTLNRAAVHAAAGGHGVGAVKASPELRRKAARALVRLYATLGEDPPESLTRLAGETKTAVSTDVDEPVDDPLDALLDVDLESAALDLEGQLPEVGELEGKWAGALLDLEGKYDTSPIGRGGDNWVTQAGGFPPFLRAVAHALIRRGKSKSNAIQIAIGRIRRWAAGEGNVTAKTQAKAQSVVAWWEAHTGAGKDASPDAETESGTGLLGEWDPTAEVGPDAAHLPPAEAATARREIEVETKVIPYVAGSWEERRELLDGAVRRFLLGDEPEGNGERGKRFVSVSATFDDWLVATVYTPGRDSPDPESYRIDYEIADGLVLLGDPTPAKLAVTVQPGEDDPGAVMTMAGMDSAVTGAKLLCAELEGKAGRVLSGSNAQRIASAVEALVAVLRSAGVPLTSDGEREGPAASDVPPEAKAAIVTPVDLIAAATRLRAAAAGMSGR